MPEEEEKHRAEALKWQIHDNAIEEGVETQLGGMGFGL